MTSGPNRRRSHRHRSRPHRTAEHVADDDPAHHRAGLVAAAVAGGVRALRGLDVGLGQRLGLRRQ